MLDGRRPTGWLCDMDGVLIHDDRMVDGADRFLARLRELARPFLIVTNNPLYEPVELADRLVSMGLVVAPEELWTSAQAAAADVAAARPGARVFAMGAPALSAALVAAGCVLDDADPEVVVVGETRGYSFSAFAAAIGFVARGARFVATNPEATSVTIDGVLPGTGAMSALIAAASGVAPYVVGKPNPAMVREGLARLGTDPASTVMVGDRLDVDVAAGVAAGVRTVLCLTGVATAEEARVGAVEPDLVVGSVADLVDEV